MRVLALDLGTKCGYALKDNDGEILSGVMDFTPRRFEGGGMRFLRFKEHLLSFWPLDRIYFEEVRAHAGTDAAHIYGGFLAHLTAWCEEKKVPYAGIPVGTIKKFATGKGNSNKEKIIEAYERKFGKRPADDNEADATFLLHFALQTIPR